MTAHGVGQSHADIEQLYRHHNPALTGNRSRSTRRLGSTGLAAAPAAPRPDGRSGHPTCHADDRKSAPPHRQTHTSDFMETQHPLLEHAQTFLATISREVDCKICGNAAPPFDIVDFGKTANKNMYPYGVCGVPVVYNKCKKCGFIFTRFFDAFTDEQWKTHLYNDDYYIGVDPEYSDVRPQSNVRELRSILVGKRKVTRGLDYGGGNGKTAALMRSHGWTFDCWDPYGKKDDSEGRTGTYNFCSSFEVFEHTADPVASLGELLSLCSKQRLLIMISTFAHDRVVTDSTRLSWWYAAPRNGHISLYSHHALDILASRFSLSYVSLSKGTHLMGREYSAGEMKRVLIGGKLVSRIRTPFRPQPLTS